MDNRPVCGAVGGDGHGREAGGRIVRQPVHQRAAADHHAQVGALQLAGEIEGEEMIAVALRIERNLAQEGGLLLI